MQQIEHTLTPAAKKFVLDKLLKGGQGLDILKELLGQGFTYEACLKSLQGNLPKGLSYAYDEHFYQKLAQPKFLGHPGVTDHSSDKIQLYTVDNFLTPQECQFIIDLSKPNLNPSTVTTNVKDYRTSNTCHFSFLDNERARELEQRFVEFLALGAGGHEVMQVQHYAVGQEFKEHSDYFTPGSSEFKEYARGRGQRTWTFMLYLNEGCEGGETTFTKVGKVFHPKTGMAVIWNSLWPNGMPNSNSQHLSTPVKSGEKVIITKWFRTHK